MTLQDLILFALKASIALSVFAIGLQSRFDDAVALLRRPNLLVRSVLAMNVVMPLVAAAMAWAFDLPVAVEIALVALAVSPIPPVLPKKQIKAHGEPTYAIGLLVAAAAFAVVFVPLAVELLGQAFATQAHMRVWPVARLVLATVLAPLAGGMLVRRAAPALALRFAKPAALVGAVLLALSFIPVLVTAWPSIVALVGSGTLWALTAFVLIGLAVGHLLGGPDPHDRTVLALAAATRHPGVAMAIGSANFPGQSAVLPAILLYVVLGTILTIPYVMWRKRVG
ncbi:MAG TPA: Na+-dependent transporter [Roseiarcus sp.]|nr:Na+-dependent transporter [Roseiarcus sp.]